MCGKKRKVDEELRTVQCVGCQCDLLLSYCCHWDQCDLLLSFPHTASLIPAVPPNRSPKSANYLGVAIKYLCPDKWQMELQEIEPRVTYTKRASNKGCTWDEQGQQRRVAKVSVTYLHAAESHMKYFSLPPGEGDGSGSFLTLTLSPLTDRQNCLFHFDIFWGFR